MGDPRVAKELIEQLAVALGELENISELEDALEKLSTRIGQSTFDQRLAQFPTEDNEPKKCPRCKRQVPVRVKNKPRTFDSLFGTHTLVRNYHYCNACKHGFCPRDIELGLPGEGDVTLKLEARLLDFAVNSPYARDVERWEFHYPHRPYSANMFRQVAKRVGRRLELSSPDVLQQQLAPSPTGQKKLLYVLNDGGMLPGLRCWKEAKVGVLVRGENYAAQGPAQRGVVSQARYVATWGDQEEFKELMRAALDAERWQRFEQIVWLGDGAKGNWNLADTLAPLAIKILDLMHAMENGNKCGKALLGEGHCLLEDWQRRIGQLLYAGDVNALIRELMECWLPDETMPATTDEQLAALDALIGYYHNNRDRMNYPSYRAQGFMIGSGIVEAAHRHVLQERMKLSGQHWSEPHGRRMVALRAAYRTAGPKRFHDAINRAACITYIDVERKRRAAAKNQAQLTAQTTARAAA